MTEARARPRGTRGAGARPVRAKRRVQGQREGSRPHLSEPQVRHGGGPSGSGWRSGSRPVGWRASVCGEGRAASAVQGTGRDQPETRPLARGRRLGLRLRLRAGKCEFRYSLICCTAPDPAPHPEPPTPGGAGQGREEMVWPPGADIPVGTEEKETDGNTRDSGEGSAALHGGTAALVGSCASEKTECTGRVVQGLRTQRDSPGPAICSRVTPEGDEAPMGGGAGKVRRSTGGSSGKREARRGREARGC